MFKPNKACVVHKTSGKTDVFGMPAPASLVKERCTVVKFNIKNEKSAVRADTSASRGNAREFQDDAEFLLTKNTVVEIDDILEVAGHKFRIASKHTRYDLQGFLDHYQVTASYWSNT